MLCDCNYQRNYPTMSKTKANLVPRGVVPWTLEEVDDIHNSWSPPQARNRRETQGDFLGGGLKPWRNKAETFTGKF